jgi:hypothetical protein
MQGLVNFTTAIADSIAVALPALCYLMACVCFLFAGWTFRSWAYQGHHHHHHHFHSRPWVPFVSLILSGVFATFPQFLNMANVSAGTNLVTSLTSYQASTPGNANNILGATPQNTVINVVTLFQYFFEAFGAACVWWAIVRWRAIVNGRNEGSPTACAVQFAFGVMCINILSVANGVVSFFQTGG